MSEKRGACECRRAADSALDADGIDGAIQLAGAAFHAGLLIDGISHPALHFERGVRASVYADTASNAKRWVVLKSVGGISI